VEQASCDQSFACTAAKLEEIKTTRDSCFGPSSDRYFDLFVLEWLSRIVGLSPSFHGLRSLGRRRARVAADAHLVTSRGWRQLTSARETQPSGCRSKAEVVLTLPRGGRRDGFVDDGTAAALSSVALAPSLFSQL
jgi:hypothetical protein